MNGKAAFLLLLALGLIFAGGGMYLNFLQESAPTDIPPAAAAPSSTVPATAPEEDPEPPAAAGPRVRIGTTVIPVDLADTDAERQQGLSGRPSLDADKGMFFVFPKAGRYSFWMPDMNFPIDIIWINDGRVVDITPDVPNDFDPEDPVHYRPDVPAQYVLEVNAGFAAAKDIRTGAAVELISI